MPGVSKPRVNHRPVASRHAAPGERILEVWDDETRTGCLLSIRVVGEEGERRLRIEAYRCDEGVHVCGPYAAVNPHEVNTGAARRLHPKPQ